MGRRITKTLLTNTILRFIRTILENASKLTKEEFKKVVKMLARFKMLSIKVERRSIRKTSVKRRSRYMKLVAGTKVFDFVSATCNLTENAKKSKAIQIKWFHDYQWLCDKYRKMEENLDRLCDDKRESEETSNKTKIDRRSCLPFPKTSNDAYGWLARKPEFQLETYGRLMIKYHDPTDDITLLGGDIPTLAGGKGFY